METVFFEADGEIVRLGQLEIEKVRDLVLMLDAGKIPFASLVECRKIGILETVVFDVEVEVPQLCRWSRLWSEVTARNGPPVVSANHRLKCSVSEM